MLSDFHHQAITLKDQYEANKHEVHGLENAIRRFINEGGLATFRKSETVVVHPLKAGISIYTITADELDEDSAELLVNNRTHRVCWEDSSTGDTGLAVLWSGSRSTLWVNCDRGAGDGWVGYNFLFNGGAHLRGDVTPDCAHRRQRATLDAWHKTGLTPAKFELNMVWNVFKGAWMNQTNFGNMIGCMKTYYKNSDYKNPVFSFCYQYIVWYWTNGDLPNEFGSDCHMQAVWTTTQESKLLKQSGSMTKLSRWYAWSEKERALQPYFGETVYALLAVGISKACSTASKAFRSIIATRCSLAKTSGPTAIRK